MEEQGWSVRVRSADKDRAIVYARSQTFEVGAPASFDQEYPHITALEQLLGAVGADLVNSLLAIAKAQRAELDGVEAVVHAELNNPLTYLGVVGEQGHPGVEKLSVKMYVSSVEEEERIRSMWAETLRRSPLAHTFQHLLELDLSLETVI